MAEPTQDEKRPFELQARTATSGQTDVLEVDVRNKGQAAWDAFTLVELKIPADLAAPAVQRAALDARTSIEPNNMATLAGIVNAAAGWSVWAINDPNDSIVVVRVFNGVDQQLGQRTEANTPLAADAVLTLRIPLAAKALKTQFEIDYGYQTDNEDVPRVDGSLELKPSYPPQYDPPTVSLTSDQENPTLIKPGDDVVVKWKVEKGIAATLRGPLPGGNSQLTLSRDEKANYYIGKGELPIKAVGPMTYILDAEVQGPEGGPNVQIIRTLTLDIYSADKYAHLSVYPKRVLPNGKVEIEWTVWGVEKAFVFLGDRDGIELELTEQNLSRTYNGTGTWLVHATQENSEETVSLKVVNDPEHEAWKEEKIKAVLWKSLKKPVFTGKPVALTVADGVMALLTSDGLYTAQVGRDARDSKDPVFERSGAAGKAWHALAALGREFVTLRRTDGDDIVLERYDAKGLRVGLPITLPADFQSVARRGGAVFDLVGFGNRVYVVAEARVQAGYLRAAYSVRFAPDEHVRAEGFLASLTRYRLTGFAGALYAYQRGTGRMLRFGLTQAGDLDRPRRAASAVNAEGASMIRTGLLVPVGNVLAVLDPASFPSFDSLKVLGLLNVVQLAFHTLKQESQANKIPQDLSYNPQRDAWEACGHGLDIQAGAVAAFRGGASRRLWVLQPPPDGSLHTLPLPYEVLFAPDFVDNLHNVDLAPALDATREFTLANSSGFDLEPVDDVCRAAGVDGLSTDGLVELLTPLAPIRNFQRMNFKFSYSSADTKEVRLRLMAAKPIGPRFLLEVTLSGERLGSVATVFKRLAADSRLDDVPDSLNQHTVSPITVREPRYLQARTKLLIINGTPVELGVSPAVGVDKIKEYAEVELSFNTPEFKISVPGVEKAGHAWVTLDYGMPKGIEVSPRAEPQRKLIRVVSDDARLLDLSAEQYDGGRFMYEKYEGSKYPLHVRGEVFWCRVAVKKKFELDGVRVGDAVSYPTTPAVYVPLAKPDETSRPRVYKFENGEVVSSTDFRTATKGGVFSRPNAVALNEQHVNAVFAEPVLNHASHDLSIPWSVIFENANLWGYKEVIALGAGGKDAYMLGRKDQTSYFFVAEQYPNNRWEMKLDQASIQPSVGAWLAVSPDGKWAALCQWQGLLMIDTANRKVVPVHPIRSAHHPAHVLFSHDGQWVYCAHVMRGHDPNPSPRRVVSGQSLIVTRVRVGNPSEQQSVLLPDVRSDFGLTADTRQNPSELKDDLALSLALSPDGQSLFVSAGTTIMRIALPGFSLNRGWSATVELPCRLACVKEGWGDTWTVYALGSYYKGDGTKVDEFKTHLYTIPVPR